MPEDLFFLRLHGNYVFIVSRNSRQKPVDYNMDEGLILKNRR